MQSLVVVPLDPAADVEAAAGGWVQWYEDACTKGQTRRAEVYTNLLERLDQATA